jgi:hypothetical protein
MIRYSILTGMNRTTRRIPCERWLPLFPQWISRHGNLWWMRNPTISHVASLRMRPSPGCARSRTRRILGHHRGMHRQSAVQIWVAQRLVRTVTMLTPDWEGLYTIRLHLAGMMTTGLRLQGVNGIAGRRLATGSPHGDTRTGLMEPCGALPRKCLFIYVWMPYVLQ